MAFPKTAADNSAIIFINYSSSFEKNPSCLFIHSKTPIHLSLSIIGQASIVLVL